MATKTETKRAEAKEAVETLHAKLAAITTVEEWTEWLAFSSRFRDYSAMNTMWMMAQWYIRREFTALMNVWTAGRIAPLAPLTQPAAASKWTDMGGHMKKGEKALSVMAPIFVRDKNDLDDAGQPKKKLIGFQLKRRTFDASQIGGIEIPERPIIECERLTGSEADDGEVWDALVAVANEAGFDVSVESIHGEVNGWCNHGTMKIAVDKDMDRPQQIKTLIHEIGHALLHGDFLGSGFLSREQKEVEAESVAFTVAHMLGRNTEGYSIGYIVSWAEGNGELIARTMGRVIDTAQRIADALEGKGVRAAKCKAVPDPNPVEEAIAA